MFFSVNVVGIFFCITHYCWIFQNNMLHLLEMALVDGINMVADILQPTTASALIDMLPMVDDCCGSFVDDYKKCHLEGTMLMPKLTQFCLVMVFF